MEWSKHLPDELETVERSPSFSEYGIKNVRRKMEDQHNVFTNLNHLLRIKVFVFYIFYIFSLRVINPCSLSFILVFLLLSGVTGVVCGRPSPLACAVGHATDFAVNAALVARQWQHRASTVSLYPPIKAEHEAGQAASTIFQVFSI